MPKYYRFRPTSPTRHKDKGDMQKSEKGLGAVLSPTQLWYLRRTTWREPARAVRGLSPAGRRQALATRWVSATSRYALASHTCTLTYDKTSSGAQVWRFPYCQLM